MDVFTGTSLSLQRDNCPLYFDVSVPRVPLNGEVVSGTVLISVGSQPVAVLNTTLEIQGQSSQGADKKNWKLKVSNASGEDVEVSVGDWLPSNKITLKSYGNVPGNPVFFDRSLVREAVSAEIWRRIYRSMDYPTSLIAPPETWKRATLNQTDRQTSALFSTDCHPAVVSFNGVFFGVCMMRTSADEGDFLMDKKNPGHYLLQPQHVSQNVLTEWQPDLWEFTSPKKPKDAAVQWFFDFFKGVVNGTTDPATAHTVLNVPSFLLYVMFCEIVGSFDSLNNNVMIGGWDWSANGGTAYFFPYDLDETLGCIWNHQGDAASFPENVGFVHTGDAAWNALFSYFVGRGDVGRVWSRIRTSGVLDPQNIWEIIRKYSGPIGSDLYLKESAAWGTNVISAPFYLQDWVVRRIAWLDAQWGYSA